MTKIRYYHDASVFRISFSGHAGYAACGKDIVCAAVSVLAGELILACDRALERGEIEHFSYTAESGNVNLRFRYGGDGALREVIEVVLQCLREVASQYPSYLALIKSNVSSSAPVLQ